MPHTHHHQEDYGYNPQFFSASKEDFMSNLIGTNFQTPESAYVYMQSTPIPSFASFHQSILVVLPLITSSRKSNLLFLINNFNHKNMNEYIDS